VKAKPRPSKWAEFRLTLHCAWNEHCELRVNDTFDVVELSCATCGKVYWRAPGAPEIKVSITVAAAGKK
jgi:hypothetical protein